MKAYQTLKQQTLIIAVLYVGITLVSLNFFPFTASLLIASSLAMVGLLWRLYRALHRQIGEQQFAEFRQLEALSGLYNTLNIQHPLPRTRHTAASPDFLHLLATEIFHLKPDLIVEVGSGTSTLIAAYCLKKIGRGRIISLDHLEKYADITRQTVLSHGLDSYASVLHAPLKDYKIDGSSYQWYDDAVLSDVKQIDMLIVDGPPHDVSAWARYPAIPLLKDRLNNNSVMLLDDGARKDETAIVAAWQARYGLNCSTAPTEKGAFVGKFSDRNN
jgi:predicted O-methyltransferase YrrM